MLAFVTHILPVTAIQRDRMLPSKGKVLARKGQKVNPDDVVAEACVNPEHIILDVARGLGLSPEEADKNIVRKAGEEIEAGDVVAGPIGLGRRVVRAPKAGKVVVAGSGQVLLETASRPTELKAGFTGAIAEQYLDLGVQVETTGALIQCFWGNGRIDSGMLSLAAHNESEELTPERLDISLRGTVVFGGTCANAEVLKIAEELPLRGLILASMSSLLIPDALKARFPVVVVDGFGKFPMDPVAYKLLSTSDKREVSLFALQRDPYTGVRPEIIIPLPSISLPPTPSDLAQFRTGQQVRIQRVPYQAMVGTLARTEPDPVKLPSGIQAQAATIHLENGENVVVPLVNLEVLV